MTPTNSNERSYLLSPGGVSIASGRLYTSSAQKPGLPRMRILSTQSGLLLSQLEDSIISTVSTSYGPIIVRAQRTVRSYGMVLGLGLAFLSAILFTVNNFLFQFWRMNETDMLLTRGVLQAVSLGIIVIASSCFKAFLPTNCIQSSLVLSQGLLNGLRVGMTFASMKYLPIGDALTIKLTEPIWTLILAKLFLKTPIGLWKFAFSCTLFTGVILCAQPPFIFDNFKTEEDLMKTAAGVEDDYIKVDGYYIGLAFAVGTGICGAVTNILVSKCSDVSYVVLTFWSGVGGAVVAVVYGLTLDTEDRFLYHISAISVMDIMNLVLLSAFGLLGFLLLTRALHLLPPTTVAVIRVVEIVLAYILQAFIMYKVPNSLAMIGSSLVIISVIGVSAENIIMTSYYGIDN